ncbi:MAG: DNA-binding response OmpR family regulator [Candidatus Latescibacterota bacterium]
MLEKRSNLSQKLKMPKTPCILVVDDEKDVLAVLIDLIETDGYRAIGTTDPEKALDIVQAEEVDLVIVDLMMPKRDGWHLLDDIKKYDTSIPVIVITGFLSQQSEAILASKHADSYLIKPVDHDRLQSQLQLHLMDHHPEKVARIVVVDADQNTREDTDHALSRRGFQIATFDALAPADASIQNTPPDLIILDITFPEGNGFDLCQTLQKSPDTKHIPMLILTSESSRQNLMKAIQLGVRGFVAKPAPPNALVERVLKILRQSPTQ